jgi:hypothetical protein
MYAADRRQPARPAAAPAPDRSASTAAKRKTPAPLSLLRGRLLQLWWAGAPTGAMTPPFAEFSQRCAQCRRQIQACSLPIHHKGGGGGKMEGQGEGYGRLGVSWGRTQPQMLARVAPLAGAAPKVPEQRRTWQADDDEPTEAKDLGLAVATEAVQSLLEAVLVDFEGTPWQQVSEERPATRGRNHAKAALLRRVTPKGTRAATAPSGIVQSKGSLLSSVSGHTSSGREWSHELSLPWATGSCASWGGTARLPSHPTIALPITPAAWNVTTDVLHNQRLARWRAVDNCASVSAFAEPATVHGHDVSSPRAGATTSKPPARSIARLASIQPGKQLRRVSVAAGKMAAEGCLAAAASRQPPQRPAHRVYGAVFGPKRARPLPPKPPQTGLKPPALSWGYHLCFEGEFPRIA